MDTKDATMDFDYDDDTHMCLRCRATIVGLPAYISHKKTDCPALKPKTSTNAVLETPVENVKNESLSLHQTEPSDVDANLTLDQTHAFVAEDLPLRQDTFFSMLELQSKSSPEKADRPVKDTNDGTGIHLVLPELDFANLEQSKSNEIELEPIGYGGFMDESSESDQDEIVRPTGGKWKPGTARQPKWTKWASQPSPPPASHTKGKWLPGKRKADIAYESGDDDRVKANEITKSDDTTKVDDGECDQSLVDDSICLRRDAPFRVKVAISDKKSISARCSDDGSNKENSNIPDVLPNTRKSTRARRQKRSDPISDDKCEFECPPCKRSFDTERRFVHHLLTRLHSKRAEHHPFREKLIFDNQLPLTWLAPFQCSLCSFYFNHQEDFLAHWISDAHERLAEQTVGPFVCSGCEFDSDDNADMFRHLSSEEHKKRAKTANRGQPIIVGEKRSESSKSLKSKIGDVDDMDVDVIKLLSGVSPCKIRKMPGKRLPTVKKSYPCSCKCQHCDNIFEDFSELRDHVREMHSERLIKCDVCLCMFVLESEFNLHVCQGATSPNKKSTAAFECKKCDYVCRSKTQLVFHETLHETPLEVLVVKDIDGGLVKRKITVKKYKCPYCQKAYQKAALRSHLNVHTGERTYKCDICTKSFAQKGTLKLHQKRHINGKKFKCDQCSFAAEKPSRLKRHKLIHEDVRPRSFLCDICGTGYHDRWALKHHMKLHFGKDFKCSHEGCTQAFRCRSELDVHMRIHTDERPFLCDQCGYRGRSQHQLTKHRRSHTGERPFKCTYCSYSAHLGPHLQRHMRIHTGSKPYKCPYCTYTCNTQENIRKHILKTKKHEGKKVYPCRFCDYGCNSASEYKTHILDNHKDSVGEGEVDVISLIAGIYDTSDDKKPVESPIPYTPRYEREKKAKKLLDETMRKKKANAKVTCLNEITAEALTASEQILYAISVPEKEDELSLKVQKDEKKPLRTYGRSPANLQKDVSPLESTGTTEVNDLQVFVPEHIDDNILPQEEFVLPDTIQEDNLLESNNNTYVIYIN